MTCIRQAWRSGYRWVAVAAGLVLTIVLSSMIGMAAGGSGVRIELGGVTLDLTVAAPPTPPCPGPGAAP